MKYSLDTIYKEFTKLLDDKNYYNEMHVACNPYGDGKACERIIKILKNKNCEEWKY